MIEIIEVYNDWLDHNQEQRKKEFKHLKKYFSASSAGSCYKKNIFKLFGFQEKEIEKRSKRLLRLGTIIHEDFEKAMEHYIKTRSDDVSDDYEFFIEKEIFLDKYNVAGHLDLAILDKKRQKLIVYDYKTKGSYPWKLQFGRNPKPKTMFNYEMQLATYAMGMSKTEGAGTGVEMALIYYNKDTSVMKQVNVEETYAEMAREYWETLNEWNDMLESLHFYMARVKEDFNEAANQINNLMPREEMVGIPFENWECRYCPLDHICTKGE